jgi:hypothetical protein
MAKETEAKIKKDKGTLKTYLDDVNDNNAKELLKYLLEKVEDLQSQIDYLLS